MKTLAILIAFLSSVALECQANQHFSQNLKELDMHYMVSNSEGHLWRGPYIGISVGYAFDAKQQNDTVLHVKGLEITYYGMPIRAYQAGLHVGFMYQLLPGNSLAIGVEADGNYAPSYETKTIDVALDPKGVADPDNTFSVLPIEGLNVLEYYGTLRGRVGYVFNKMLFYCTTGFAYGGGGRRFTSELTQRNFQIGYAIGAGVEHKLDFNSTLDNVTLKVEALYVNLERDKTYLGAYGITDEGQFLYADNYNHHPTTSFFNIKFGVTYNFFL